MNREYVEKKIREHSTEIVDKFGIKRLSIFGSVARDESTESSDIDFLVEYQENKLGFHSYIDLLLFLEDVFGTKVDLVIWNTAKPLILESAEKDALKLLEVE